MDPKETARERRATKRNARYAAKHLLPRLALWAGVGVFVCALLLSCGDDDIGTSDLILRVYYEGAGISDFDAFTFERLRHYGGIEADLCAFDRGTGAIWVATGSKVYKFDDSGNYVFGGVELRSRATDIVVNEKTHYAWVFREDGALSRFNPIRVVNNQPDGTFYLNRPHTGNTEYFLEPDNNRGGCWIIAKNELYYDQEWGAILTKRVFEYPITAASAAGGECGCWLATKDDRGVPELLYVDRNGKKLKMIVEGVREIERLELSEKEELLWMVDKVKRGGVEYRDLRVMGTNGVLKAVAPNVTPGAVLAVDPDRGYCWYYGRTGLNVNVYAYDEDGGDVYERLRLIGVGEIGRKAGGFTLLDPGLLE